MSHLMFADDLLIFGEASESQMHCVIETFDKFYTLSGQDISYGKTSILFSSNDSRAMKRKLQHMSKFSCTKNFGRYLRVPLSGKNLKRADFQYIVDQVTASLNSWKRNSLALEGRITLAKSFIESIPLYTMMTNKPPKTCIDEIQSLHRKFVWGYTEDKKKILAIAWDKVTMPKHLGGVGLRDLNILNQVCIMKLGWTIHNNPSALWCNAMRKKNNMRNSSD